AIQPRGQGPLWQEVQEALRIVPSTPTMSERLKSLGAEEGRRPMPRPDWTRLAGVGHMPWSWPGVRELVPATLTSGVLLAGAVGLHALPVRAVDHVQEAYNLDYAATPSKSAPRLSITPRW